MEFGSWGIEKAVQRVWKAVQALIRQWIAQPRESKGSFDVTQDPVFLMEGYESDAPADFSINPDKYLYEKTVQ